MLLDRETIRAALINLVKNALEAMPDGGSLTVITRITRNGVALDLIDTGLGMDEKTALHMFDAFYSTKDGGSGLGTAHRSEDHRGAWRAHQRAERRRARHEVHAGVSHAAANLSGVQPPAEPAPDDPAPADPGPADPGPAIIRGRSCMIEVMSESAPASAAATVRVLIVDNDPALAQAMAESLERVGYPCHVATSGPEGVRAHRTGRRSTSSITDLVMNDVDGMEVLARAKAVPARVRGDHGHRARVGAQGGRGDAAGGVQLPGKADHAQPACGP